MSIQAIFKTFCAYQTTNMTIDDDLIGNKESRTDLQEIWDGFNDDQIMEIIFNMHQQYNCAHDLAALEKEILKELDRPISEINEFNYPVDEINCASDQPTSMSENEPKLFKCVPCGVAYRHKTSLQRHDRQSCSTRKKAPVNGKWKKLLKQTAKHKVYRHSDFSCKKCSREFNSLRSLQNHNRVHLPKLLRFVAKKRRSTKVDKTCVSENSECVPCEVKYSLHRHKRDSCSVAEKMTDFWCKKCSREFNSSRSLHNHNRIHLPRRLRFVAKKKRTTKVDKKFVKVTEAVRAIYSCSICSKQFSTKFSLRGHMRYHSHTTKFDCTLCTKSYKFKAYLTKHMESHELPFH